MKEVRVVLPDEEYHVLEQIAKTLDVSVEEILKRSLAEYLEKVRRDELAFEPIGFGMWAHRSEMQDATRWVQELRCQEWKR
ncbi:MAG: ribbon-helix-helix protein, CopG family [Nitrospinota bacterium]|nr:MAG: ribbon-helix-helix protein, CopG family [Nitrospinota bacterium]